MKVKITTTDGSLYLFDNVTELTKLDFTVRVKHGNVVQCFDPDAILELKVDGKDIGL